MKPPSVTFKFIGLIHSGHRVEANTPIQPVYAHDCLGRVEIFPDYTAGLADIEGFSYLYLIYWLHRARPPQLRVRPFLQDEAHGIFATRAPCRPNPIGMSLVRLVRREGDVLHIAGVDVLDGTPLLDLKPYSPRYDTVEQPRSGWIDSVNDTTAQCRGRRGYRIGAAGGSNLPAETPTQERKSIS